jgi:hypothetical protein
MVKHITRNDLIREIKRAIDESPHTGISKADGRAGLLLEDILGIEGGNHALADAVGFELKTSISPNTPVTLFHKEPLPKGSTTKMVHRFGWPATYTKDEVTFPVKSFRATIYGSWKSQIQPVQLDIVASNEKVSVMCDGEEVSHWDSNNLIAAASQKLRNMMLVFARDNCDGTVSFLSANLLENFQPFGFLKAIQDGIVAIEWDARTNPNKDSVRNHGTKFRIRERDLPAIYTHTTPIFPS